MLAHHMQDQAETMLMRLARGSGIDGLGAMAAVSFDGGLAVVRPFLDTDRAVLRAAAQRAGFGWVDDPANKDARHERVRWRQAAEDLAALGLDAPALARSAARLRAERDALDEVAEAWCETYAHTHALGFITLAAAPFDALPAALQQRIVRRSLHDIGGGDYMTAPDAVAAFLEKRAARATGGHTLSGCLLRWRGDTLMIGREAAALGATRTKLPPRGALLWDGRFRIGFARGFPRARYKAAALGRAGLDSLRARQVALPPRVPVAYLHALPALFGARGRVLCPSLDPCAEVRVSGLEKPATKAYVKE